MSINTRTLLVFAVTTILLVFGAYIASETTLVRGFAQIEQQAAEDTLRQFDVAFSRRLTMLGEAAVSSGHWDDTYRYVSSGDPDYIADNFYPEAIERFYSASLVAIANPAGRVMFARQIDPATKDEIEVPSDLAAAFVAGGALDYAALEENGTTIGLLTLGGQPMLVAASPILTSLSQGPSAGTLLFARAFDASVAADFAAQLSRAASVLLPDDTRIAESIRADLLASPLDTPTAIHSGDEAVAYSYALLRDLNDAPAAIFEIDFPRAITALGVQAQRVFTGILVVAGLLFTGITLMLLHFLVYQRLFQLSSSVNAIGLSGDGSLRVREGGRDQLGTLARDINLMLENLERSQQTLKTQGARIHSQNETLVKSNRELGIARRKAEEAARAKGEFLSTMTHELRTPLNAIIGYSEIQIAGMSGALTPEQQDLQKRILANAEHLLGVISNVLDMSKLEAERVELTPTLVTPQALMNEVIFQSNGLISGKPITLRTSIDESLPATIISDPIRLKQILLNLFSNAVKFTERGEITIGFDCVDDQHWAISVCDTGIGIPAHQQQTIFEAFHQVDSSSTRARRGTGLGLSIVRQLARLMGGQVEVYSRLGEGSTFTVTLPLVAHTEVVPLKASQKAEGV